MGEQAGHLHPISNSSLTFDSRESVHNWDASQLGILVRQSYILMMTNTTGLNIKQLRQHACICPEPLPSQMSVTLKLHQSA
jgi:hypothetical protein